MITTASPSAWSSPAVNAIWCPKLREKLRPFTLRVTSRELADDLPGAVVRPIVDEDDLERPHDTGQSGRQPPVQLRDALLLVVDGHHHRQLSAHV